MRRGPFKNRSFRRPHGPLQWLPHTTMTLGGRAGTRMRHELPSPAMGDPAGRVPVPRDYLIDEAQWPDGRLRLHAPPEARLLKGIASRLQEAVGDKSLRDIAKECGVAPQTVLNILAGTTWAHALSVARLERGLNVRLWGEEHRKKPERTRHWTQH